MSGSGATRVTKSVVHSIISTDKYQYHDVLSAVEVREFLTELFYLLTNHPDLHSLDDENILRIVEEAVRLRRLYLANQTEGTL